MAYSSVRATLGGKDVKRTTRQTKPKKTYSSVTAITAPSKPSKRGYRGGAPAYPSTPTRSTRSRPSRSNKPRPPKTPEQKAIAQIKRRARKGKTGLPKHLKSAHRDLTAKKAEERVEKLWKRVKSRTNLKGPPPKIGLYDKDTDKRGATATVTSKGKLKLGSPITGMLGNPFAKKKARKNALPTVLHEFAHVRQVRKGKRYGSKQHQVKAEGRAERFAKKQTKKLKRKNVKFKPSHTYAPYTRAVSKKDPRERRRAVRRVAGKKALPGLHEDWLVAGLDRPTKGKERVEAARATAKAIKKGDYKRASKVAEPYAKVKAPKKGKVTVKVPEGVPDEHKKHVAKFGTKYLSDVAAKKGMSGPEYFAKILQFESGWNPTAKNAQSGATGLGQFIPSTRADFKNRLGVDPYKNPKENLKASAMHLSGKFGYGEGYEGYNPGYGDYDAPLRENVGKTVKVKVPRKAVKGAKDQPKKAPGPWAGSKQKLGEVLKGVASKSEWVGDKRTPQENSSVGGSPTSDHLTTNTASFAADLPADDKIAQKIAKRLGMASHRGTNTAVKDGYQYQLIWQTAGHYDHVHIGAKWVGEGVPPGTTLGGSAGGVAPGGVGAAPAVASSEAAIKVDKKDKKKRKKKEKGFTPEQEAALALITPPGEDEVVPRFTARTTRHRQQVKRRTKTGL